MLILEGERGIGKTRLLEETKRLCYQTSSVLILSGAGDTVEKHTPFFPWRDVFAQLFGLGPEVRDRCRWV